MNAATGDRYKVSIKQFIKAGYYVLLIAATWKATNVMVERKYPKKVEKPVEVEKKDSDEDLDQEI